MKTIANSCFRRALGVAVVSSLLAVSASAQAIFDDFNGTAVDTAIWYPRLTSGSIVQNDDSLIRFTTGVLTTSQRAFLVSNSINNNPFAGALTITFDNLTLAGTPTADQPTWGNAFYAAVGRASTDNGAALDNAVAGKYTAVGGDYITALGLNVRKSDTATLLQIVDRGAANHTTASFNLSGTPTDIVWTIDGTGGIGSWSVMLTGATFIDTGLSSASGSFIKFNQAEFDASGTSVSRLAFGAINVGNVVDVTAVTLDSVTLSTVPEPSTYALLASAFVGGLVIYRRTRQTRR